MTDYEVEIVIEYRSYVLFFSNIWRNKTQRIGIEVPT